MGKYKIETDEGVFVVDVDDGGGGGVAQTEPATEDIAPGVFSRDWWLTRPDGSKADSFSGATADLFTKALSGLTFGAGDEITAAGAAALDKMESRYPSYSSLYNARLNQVRGRQKKLEEDLPVASTLLELGGGLKIPFTLLNDAKKAGALKTAAKTALEGGGYGAAYGFGSGEGGAKERLAAAASGGATGAAAGGLIGIVPAAGAKGAKYIREHFSEEGRKMALSAVGATKSKIAKALNAMPDVRVERMEDFENPISEALTSFRKQAGNDFKMEGFDLTKEVMAQKKGYVKRINNLLQDADAALREPVDINFGLTDEYLSTLSATQKKQGKKIVDKLKKDILAEHDGSLTSLHREKIALGERIQKSAYGSDKQNLKTNILKRVRADLRRSVENGYERATGEGKTIAELNRELGKRENLQPLFKNILAGDEADNILKAFIHSVRTTGGVGQLIIASAAGSASLIGGLPGMIAAPLVFTYLHTPKGKLALADMLRSPKTAKGARMVESFLRKTGGVVGKTSGLFAGKAAAESASKNTENDDGNLGQVGDLSSYTDIINSMGIAAPTTKKKTTSEADNVVDDKLIAAVIAQESAGNPSAVSPKGAQGLMQLMDDTAAEMADKLGMEKYDLKNPEDNVKLGTAYLAHLQKRFPNTELMLAAYNAGPTRVSGWMRKYQTSSWPRIEQQLARAGIYRETRNYVKRVMANYNKKDE